MNHNLQVLNLENMGICEPALKQICMQLKYAISLKSILLSANPGISDKLVNKMCEYLSARAEPQHRTVKQYCEALSCNTR